MTDPSLAADSPAKTPVPISGTAPDPDLGPDLGPDADPDPDPNAAALTVIVVSYNTRALTLAALRTLHETTTTTRLRTVVFDNASKDGSADAIAAAFPEVTLIRSEENLGFARANNVVAKAATTDWLLLLNPDTEVHAGAVDALIAFARANPRGGIYGGRTVFPDGALNIASCFARITPWSVTSRTFGLTTLFPNSRLFNPEVMGGWQRDSVREVDVVVGCFLLIRRALWDRLGGFDLRYYMYGEDADLCLRARALGYRPMITPDAEIMHLVGAASRTRADKMVLLARGRLTLIHDHWPSWQVPYGRAMMWLWAGSRSAATGLLARLRPTASNRARAETWAHIWAERRAWLTPY